MGADLQSYALSGYVDWRLAGLLIFSGGGGVALSILLSRRLAVRKGLLERIFAFAVLLVGTYVVVHSV